MADENGLGKGVVFGELCYAGKPLDVDPLIDRVGKDAAALSVYSTRLHFYISTPRGIVAGVQDVRVVAPAIFDSTNRHAVSLSPLLPSFGNTGPRGLPMFVGRSIRCRRTCRTAPCGVPDAR